MKQEDRSDDGEHVKVKRNMELKGKTESKRKPAAKDSRAGMRKLNLVSGWPLLPGRLQAGRVEAQYSENVTHRRRVIRPHTVILPAAPAGQAEEAMGAKTVATTLPKSSRRMTVGRP